MNRSTFVAAALALACAPVVSSAQTVLFSDNYDAGTSASRYDFYSLDNETTPSTYGAGTFLGDTFANFNFNYGAYTYRYTAPDGITPLTGLIPSAPRSTGGSTVGLRFDVNNSLTGTAIINAYPKLNQFLNSSAPSGDHKLTFDIWMNYNGGFQGGGGSTEWFYGGINQDGNGIGAARLGQEPAGVSRGYGMVVNGERGNSNDYRFYRNNTRFLSTPIATPPLETGYVATPDTFNVGDGRNAFYQNLFQFPDYETPGSIGKRWNTVEIEYTDGIVYYRINGNLIAARSDNTVTSGNILLGYGDFNNTSAANDDVTLVDANFGIFDNVEVVTTTQVRPKWNVNSDGNWSNAGNWTNGVPDGNTATADFTDAINAPRAITVDGGRTVRSMVFDNASSYTVGGDAITFDSLTTGIHGSIVVRNGNHTVNSPIVLNRPLAFNVTNAASTVTLTSAITANNNGYIKFGPGTAVARSIETAGSFNVVGGTLRLAAGSGTSKVTALRVEGATDAWAAKLDITNNGVIIDYNTTLTVLSTVQNQLKNGYAGGAWTGNGIVSSSAAGASTHAVGYGEASEVVGVGGGTFGGVAVDDTAIVMRYTRQGDANLDGITNISDFALLAANFNTTSGWTKGDFNYDGSTNIGDFALLTANFNQSAGDLPRGGAVPEPASFGLAVAALALIRRRR